ncbi:MAG: spore maturation protein [Candidatus Marinimicrobia bacterium]|jgi:spore maturation protein B|nr:spore maturation protein [Candidatus Neomarinimicrobiota bacterium]MBT3631801.1 spore maturation protein [Candidatus Neomarinimicrobiota bacterium]MBT3825123.1 spore maturation protein [Candidatus Neomarinimicrobiota bacterium]MBT4130352.1 spore maturation protein [Candidatus Neomarinimicrobiota bacterium]MBT4295325.1 spore maturation protein [Candidatus Neomarinimicrobiota bacterium]
MFQGIMNGVSAVAIPVLLLAIVGHGWYKKVKVYEAFTEGAKEGFEVAVRIIPFLVAILVAIGAFRASGALDLITGLLSPLTSWIGMPGEVIPMALMRPLSGSGAIGIMSELISTYGPDSLPARMAAIMEGSTETTFYILAVYFGSVGVKKTRHALPAALLADLAGIIAAVVVTQMVFG